MRTRGTDRRVTLGDLSGLWGYRPGTEGGSGPFGSGPTPESLGVTKTSRRHRLLEVPVPSRRTGASTQA